MKLPQRLVITFTREGVEVRTLYSTKAGPGPSTKVRQKEVEQIARAGLEQALRALDGSVEMVGTSGFTTREDTRSASQSKPNRRGGG